MTTTTLSGLNFLHGDDASNDAATSLTFQQSHDAATSLAPQRNHDAAAASLAFQQSHDAATSLTFQFGHNAATSFTFQQSQDAAVSLKASSPAASSSGELTFSYKTGSITPLAFQQSYDASLKAPSPSASLSGELYMAGSITDTASNGVVGGHQPPISPLEDLFTGFEFPQLGSPGLLANSSAPLVTSDLPADNSLPMADAFFQTPMVLQDLADMGTGFQNMGAPVLDVSAPVSNAYPKQILPILSSNDPNANSLAPAVALTAPKHGPSPLKKTPRKQKNLGVPTAPNPGSPASSSSSSSAEKQRNRLRYYNNADHVFEALRNNHVVKRLQDAIRGGRGVGVLSLSSSTFRVKRSGEKGDERYQALEAHPENLVDILSEDPCLSSLASEGRKRLGRHIGDLRDRQEREDILDGLEKAMEAKQYTEIKKKAAHAVQGEEL